MFLLVYLRWHSFWNIIGAAQNVHIIFQAIKCHFNCMRIRLSSAAMVVGATIPGHNRHHCLDVARLGVVLCRGTRQTSFPSYYVIYALQIFRVNVVLMIPSPFHMPVQDIMSCEGICGESFRIGLPVPFLWPALARLSVILPCVNIYLTSIDMLPQAWIFYWSFYILIGRRIACSSTCSKSKPSGVLRAIRSRN